MLVREIFPTIQGEGPNTGTPAIFVRLAGCPLRCTFCDTDFREEASTRYLPAELADQVIREANNARANLVVLTGGEPLAQDLSGLFAYLRARNLRVQIETSGVIDQYVPDWVGVVVSPKTPSINYSWNVTAWKYVVKAGHVAPDDGLPYYTTQPLKGRPGQRIARPLTFGVPIYVQPCDEGDPAKNRANLDQCLDSVRRFGYRLSLQTHKIIGVP